MGKGIDPPIEWSEINAALGQCLLLLYTLAKRLDFTFAGFELVPLGSFSRIDRIDGMYIPLNVHTHTLSTGPDVKTRYELYGSSDLNSFLFWNRKFDAGLVAFLDCLLQLGVYIEAQDSKFHFPYRIAKDRIGDLSVRYGSCDAADWTRALKYTLIDLKWISGFCRDLVEG